MNRWIAILDDSLSRIATLRDMHLGYQLVHAVRVTTFMRELDAAMHLYGCPPSLLILDHDLGIGSFEDLDGNNGMDAARMIAEGGWRSWRSPVLIWSTNADARPRMRETLREAIVGRPPPIATMPYDRPEDWQPWVRHCLGSLR
jgi:hypothetical protein